MTLGIIFCALLLIAVCLTCWPLLCPSRFSEARANDDRAVYRDQLAEVEQSLTQNLISAAQAENLKTEIMRRLLSAQDEQMQTPQLPAIRKRTTFACVAFLAFALPLGISLVYGALGSPRLPASPTTKEAAHNTTAANPQVAAMMAASPEQRQEMIKTMVENLAAKAQANPDDIAAWTRLAISYRVLGEFDKARDAIAHAIKLAPDNVKLWMAQGQIQLVAAKDAEKLPDDFIATMRHVLKLDPDNADALYYVGEAEREAGNIDAARQHWQKVIDLLPKNSPDRANLQKQLKSLNHK